MNVLVNSKGELLEILQEEKEPLDGQSIVTLDGYYEVFNEQHYNVAVWDFTENKWKGVGEPNIPPEPQPTEMEVLKKEKEALAKSVYDLTEIVELIITGGVN